MRCDVHKGKLRSEEGYQIKSFLNLNVEEDGRRILEWVPTGLLSLKWGLWYMINVHAQFSNILYIPNRYSCIEGLGIRLGLSGYS